jgi:hypothetical protein
VNCAEREQRICGTYKPRRSRTPSFQASQVLVYIF